MATMSPLDPDIEEKLKRSGLEFLLNDIEMALTFVRVARAADNDPAKNFRNRANARRAYVVVQKLTARLDFSPEEQSKINKKLRMLKIELEALGEHF